MALEINCDFRYDQGYAPLHEALRLGIRFVRCISLPEMELPAAAYLAMGIRVLAVYTGESDNAGHYVQRACSALQIGNEPQFAMDGAASWPIGSDSDMIHVWNHVANVLVPAVHPNGIPLVGPGIWCQDFAKWAMIGSRLPGLSAAAVHVYPEAGGHSLVQTKAFLSKYRSVRADLPLLCTEWRVWGNQTLPTARAIDTYCTHKFAFAWSDGVPGHGLNGTPELGILALA